MIVRDAEDSLRACLESIAPHVDAIAICDTGSKDGTLAIAREFTSNVQTFTDCNVNPLTGEREERIWDFAMARNASFAMVPDDCEFVAWCDSDDVIHGAEHLREAAASAPDGPFAYLAPYEYSYADAALTQPTCIHWRERLIRNPREMVWTTPCHEVCVPRSGGIAHQPLPSVVIKHRAQASKNPREPQRNLRILDAYLKRVGESDVRAMYYTGVELARHGMFGRARQTLERYVQLGSWSDEKCLGELELARIALQEGHSRDALDWAMRAMTTKDWPDPYWLAVQCYWQMGLEGHQAQQEYNFNRALVWAERGRPLRDAETVLFYDPTARFTTERIVARILAHRGHIDEAAEACRRGLAGLPGDADLMEQLRDYEKVRIGREIDTGLERLVHLGAISAPVMQAVQGLVGGTLALPAPPPANDAAPHPFARIGTGSAVDTVGLPPVPAGKLDIVIVTGPAMEDWTPRTIEESGIGGSETMAWEMARHLARLGHRVRHYGWCRPEQEGIYEGVHWLDSARYRDIECDALVVSRYADLVQAVGGVKAKARLLWVHDVHCGQALTPQHALRFDRILCLSNWHKSFFCETYPFIDPGRVTVTRNGIDLSLFESPSADSLPSVEEDRMVDATDFIKGLQDGRADPFRDPHRAVYSSSPDRGLQTAIELWPLVRAEVPDAELHVYYGFDGLRRGRPADAALADRLEAQAKATPGVVLHGRVSPRELAREFMRSSVWFYPTWFSETSCITAMQALSAGLRIIASPIAALNETVGKDLGILIPGAPGPTNIAHSFDLAAPTPAYAVAAVAAVVEAMIAPDEDCPTCAPFIRAQESAGAGILMNERAALAAVAAKRFALGPLAEEWSEMLGALCAEQVMPRFYVDPAMAAVARETDEAA